ncbi:IucA/IucC family protein [Salinibius halmophilus]|uniref:IucA/IucC family protein n=1 Tax=Salinibius halmophilus TaxID=1853216 RepID=UPI000E66DE23|nr:IucA/IucC family protein [Salinibius halmophilus]
MKFVANTAERFGIEALLNCYIREFALPNEQIQFTPVLGGFRVNLPPLSFSFTVSHPAPLGNYQYLSGPALNGELLNLAQLAEQLFASVQTQHNEDYTELLEQVIASQQCMDTLLQNSQPLDMLPQKDAFLISEQQLKVGHRFHPTPKARVGMSEQDWLQFSPELGQKFCWHAFAISPDLYDGNDQIQDFIKQQWMPELADEAKPVLPVHPWQAEFLLSQPEVKELLEQGKLSYLGACGTELYATSSLRSCYAPELDYFCKGSLHVRLTNCLRKNARYELETAKILSTELKDIEQQLGLSDFELISEPDFQSVLSDEKILSEGFALILRDNLFKKESPRSAMAGALFAPQPEHKPLVHGELLRAYNHQVSVNDIENWFERYAELIITPTLKLYFEHGVVLEPHLQNCVIELTDGKPSKFLYRDLEGTKLVAELWPTLPKMSDEAQQAVVYSQEKGWNRINYCLWLNHFSEAIAALANGNGQIESRLWDVVANTLARYAQQNPIGRDTVKQLLRQSTLPNKANLLVRFLRQADKQAQYIQINNPIALAYARQQVLTKVAVA